MTEKINFEALIAKEGSANWRREPPATQAQVEVLQASLPFTLPTEYIQFLLFSNGADGEISAQPYWCIIVPAQEVIEHHEGYAVPENLPGYFAFGTSGGGELLTFKIDEDPMPVYAFRCLELNDALLVADNFLDLVRMLGKVNDEFEGE